MRGIMAGTPRFVPDARLISAAVAPMALGAAIDPGWSMTIYVAPPFIIVEPIAGYVVEPLLYGLPFFLSPVSVIVSAVFWFWLRRLRIGLIMSTPLTLCLVVLGLYAKSLEFFGIWSGVIVKSRRRSPYPISAFWLMIRTRPLPRLKPCSRIVH